jgi:pilus assembly protein Flp/PilA
MKNIEIMKNIMKRLWKDEEGQDLIEYALLVALVALAMAAAFPPLVTKLNTLFTAAGTCISGGSCAP